MLVVGLAVFGAASAAAGFAPDGIVLILARFAQGAGRPWLPPPRCPWSGCCTRIRTTTPGRWRCGGPWPRSGPPRGRSCRGCCPPRSRGAGSSPSRSCSPWPAWCGPGGCCRPPSRPRSGRWTSREAS
ncbi:hypothetical protein GXW82_09115 [Streptacidiphilus sp. 4-A2]|nr:hypothetical protein [Streptacidiphilus sp. 4-A2]